MIRLMKKEDGAAVVPLILVILKDMELPFLEEHGEEKTLRILEEAFKEPAYRYGYSRGIVEEIEGEIAGVAFGYAAEEEPFIDQPLAKIFERYGVDPSTRLFVDAETFPDEWYLDSISVSEKFRGQGIGTKLLEALPTLVRHQTKIGLSVDQNNPKAKKLYLRHGFEVVGQRMISGHLYDHMQKVLD